MVYVEMIDVPGKILEEIADKRMKRNDVALTYAFGLRTLGSSETINWGPINQAIIERWSMAALRYIKERAWKIAAGKIEP